MNCDTCNNYKDNITCTVHDGVECNVKRTWRSWEPKEPKLDFEDAPHLGLGISHAPKQHTYDYMYKGIRIDPYRIFVEYEITHPAQQHSIKKLLRAGRSVKTLKEDIEESIKALERWLEMIEEDVK